MRKQFIGLVLFLILLTPVYSGTQFNYVETEKIDLDVFARDPDKDQVKVFYEAPLNEEGEWQTTYGDAGVYYVNITATDGLLSDSVEVTILVNKKEEPPKIVTALPEVPLLTVEEGNVLRFAITAEDRNNDALIYTWMFEDQIVGEGNRFEYSPGYKKSGTYTLKVIINDGVFEVVKEWQIKVENVDLEELIMNNINNQEFTENEVVRLSLPDFRHYGLKYTISDPIGNDNYWKTDQESAGTYKVVVAVSGHGFEDQKKILVHIKDDDQPPVFEPIEGQFIHEQDELILTPKAEDPDGDFIRYSVTNAPLGSQFENSTFFWQPSQETVMNTGLFATLIRKFNILSRTFVVEFIATSKNASASMEVPITVFNENRAPVLEEIPTLTFKEGEVFSIPIDTSDPDQDSLTIYYEGWLQEGETIGFDQAGTHFVKVTVSDEFLDDSQFVKIVVEDTNRPPTLHSIKDVEVAEDELVEGSLHADDPENDEITFHLIDAPPGMVIEGNLISWTPPFDIANNEYDAQYTVKVLATDGDLKDEQTFKVTVINTNRPPELITKLGSIEGEIKEPITLFVEAVDPDDDELLITWTFGNEEYEGSSHTRTFIYKGEKKGRVMISDGVDEVTEEFTILVS